MHLWNIYSSDFPEYISEISNTSSMRRLDDVGMNCGCEYTNFKLFEGLQKSSRLDHSIGVALIVWHFTKDVKQSVAGLLHDISSPVFAHVIDFLHGDYLTQEATEGETTSIICNSQEIQKYLGKLGLKTSDVDDYHLYPIADNDTPKLSADRLEYSLMNIVNYKFASEEKVRDLYDNLIVGTNENNEPEIMFTDKQKALEFALLALKCSKIYVADEDRFAMQRLSEILKECIAKGIICESDLYLTESEVIAKLKQSDFGEKEWQKYCNYSSISKTDTTGEARIVVAKKRYINPYVQGQGRVSEIFPEFKDAIEQYLSEDLNYTVYGR